MTMKKLLGIAFALLFSSAAFAADDTVIVTPGVGVPMKSKDVGSGKQAMQPILSDASGNTLLTTAGADAVSNTLTGIPVYSRALYFNGVTWDRWQGAVTLGAETTKVIGTVRIASGGVASGSFASGSIASGAVASGAMVDLGAQADSVCATDTGTCSLIALVKKTNSNTSGAVPAGSAIIGKVGIDQTTPGTTNGVQVNAALPAGTNTIGTVGQLPYPVGATPLTASATGTTGATTATLAGTGGKTTYICGYSIRANATAAATVTNTITGVITATLSSIMWVAPLASGIGIDESVFIPCVPASGTNQAIAVVSGAPGSGGTVSSRAWGYQL